MGTTFGDVSFEKESFRNFELSAGSSLKKAPAFPASEGGAWDVRDIPVKTAYHLWEAETDDTLKQEAFAELQQVIAGRSEDEALFTKIAESVCKGGQKGCAYGLQKARDESKDLACHYDLVNIVHEVCPRRAQHNPGGWNAFNMRFSQLLVNMCENRSELNHHMDSLKQIMHTEC